MKRIAIAFAPAFLFICTGTLFAQKGWKVDTVHGPVTEVRFTTSEGTWMNLDVSPDGREIAFDMLGDIYKMPVGGGKATLLCGGPGWEVQPRWSPDGKLISFTSDRAGGDNIWVMNADGTEPKQVTKESFRLVNNAVWSPEGDYIIAKKHFTGTRSLGAGEMWMYHLTGGSGLQLTKRKNDQQDVGEPCASPDGRYVYFSEDMTQGPFFQYNKNPHEGIYMIRRYDRQEGTIDNVVAGPGGAVRPQVSPDGRYLAFVRRVRTQSVLFVHDLKTGEEWPLWDGLSKDQQETWATFGVYPNYGWTPDNKSIVIWAQGKIWKVGTETKTVTAVPFECEVVQQITEAVKTPQVVSPDEFEAKMIRHASVSPDGKKVVFNAAGHLYLKDLPNGKPARLTSLTDLEFEPRWSPDGKKIVFTTWSDKDAGAVRIIDVATKAISLVSAEKGIYLSPSFSPDGKWIAYERGDGNSVMGPGYTEEPGIYLCQSDGKNHKKIIDHGSTPLFAADGRRIYLMDDGGSSKSFFSVDLSGQDEVTHFTSTYATAIVPSPDGEWVTFNELFNAYVAPFPKTGKEIDLSAETRSYPMYRLTRDAGTCLQWSGDGKSLHWMLGPELFTRKLEDCFAFVADKDSLPPMDTTGIRMGLMLKTDVPGGMVALKGARIITMKGDEVIEKGVIVVNKNRIMAIGPEGSVVIPAEAKVVDVQGKTIMPGIVDVHAHPGTSFNGVSPQQQWSYFANLAYGVTTMHDPSSNTEMTFSQAEMIKAGVMVGPRSYSTGTILYGAEGDFKATINSFDDAMSHLRRLKAVGAFSVKSYNQPRREQRQQVIEAARKLGMMVYPEGGSFFYHNMTMVMDGHTGVEHSIPVSPVYQDVVKFWGASKTGYTPTLIVGYGGVWGENYWYQKTEVWKNERLLKFYPRGILDARSMRRMMVPDEDFGHIGNARACKAIMDGGTKIQLGAHGQLHGLGAHWELWMFVQGGFSNLQAIRAATLWGAEYIGMDRDLGSLEVGKLADLVVMDKNPLEDIRNTEFISWVMKNGRLYDASTMNERTTAEVTRLPFWWESAKGYGGWTWHQGAHSHGYHEATCVCGR